MKSTRLTSDAWINAGIDLLCTAGHEALAVEPMARRLGTTKGSFYWHFKDLPAYHAALVRQWHADALSDVMMRLEDTTAPETALRRLGADLTGNPQETAMRIWSHSHPVVAASLAEVDLERLLYIQGLLNRMGLRNPAFGHALFASLVGLPLLRTEPDGQLAFDALIDTVLALA